MFGLSPLGAFHTLISLIAVAAGIIAFVRDGRIKTVNMVGKTYVVTTVITCLTGFGIFHHGGFGAPHVLGIITLVVLGIAAAAGKSAFGYASLYIETICYSATFFFHMIPAITEGATRLPAGHPLAANQDAPGIKLAISISLVLLLGGIKFQLSRLRKQGGAAGTR